MLSVRRKIRDARGTLRLMYEMDRRAFVTGTATSVLQSLLYPLILVVVWKGFSLILEGDDAFIQQAALLLGGLFALLAFETLLRIINESATTLLKAESAQQVNAQIMRKMADVPYRLFEDNDFQARYGLLISQASYRPGLLVDAFVGSVSALVGSLAIAVTIFALAPLLDIFVLLLIPLTIAEARYHGRLLNLQMTSAPELFRMVHLTQKSIDATWQRDIRVHNSSVLDDEYQVLASQYVGNLKRLLHRYQLIRGSIGIGVMAVMTLAMGVVFWQVSHSPAGPAQAAILLPALLMGLNQGKAFSSSWGELTECLGYLGQVFAFLNQSFESRATNGPRRADSESGQPTLLTSSAARPVESSPSRVCAVHLRAVSYRYPNSYKGALSEVSCTFPTGTTAIVGPNGAGKSTLVKLLTGLLAPTSGSIGIELPGGRYLSPEQADKAVLFQEPSHLYLTIRQNVTMRFERTAGEDARIHNALEVAGLTSVVKGLPDGIDTLVGAGFGGQLDLSGGQWQRLALARLIYQDAKVMVLDEPVASLDPEGERAVFELFAEMGEDRVIVFTTHRYDSIPQGTTIVVLVDGSIVEIGNHEELFQQQRHYWSLWTSGRNQAARTPPAHNGRLRASGHTPLMGSRSDLSPTLPIPGSPSSPREEPGPVGPHLSWTGPGSAVDTEEQHSARPGWGAYAGRRHVR